MPYPHPPPLSRQGVVCYPSGHHQCLGPRRRDGAQRKALEFERKIAEQSEGLSGDSLFSPHREKLVRQQLGVIADDEIEITLK